MILTPEDILAARAFFRSIHGENLINYLRENPPDEPHPPGGDRPIEPHHVQVNYGFGLGLKAWPKAIQTIIAPKAPAPEPDESPRLKLIDP